MNGRTISCGVPQSVRAAGATGTTGAKPGAVSHMSHKSHGGRGRSRVPAAWRQPPPPRSAASLSSHAVSAKSSKPSASAVARMSAYSALLHSAAIWPWVV